MREINAILHEKITIKDDVEEIYALFSSLLCPFESAPKYVLFFWTNWLKLCTIPEKKSLRYTRNLYAWNNQ